MVRITERAAIARPSLDEQPEMVTMCSDEKKIVATMSHEAAQLRNVQLRCDVRKSQNHPGLQLSARLRTNREFGDTVAIDHSVLSGFAGKPLRCMNVFDLASTVGIVVAVPSKHPKVVVHHFVIVWLTCCSTALFCSRSRRGV